jgi:hypothetical protein
MGFIIIIIFIFGNENVKVNEMLLLLKHFKMHPFFGVFMSFIPFNCFLYVHNNTFQSS